VGADSLGWLGWLDLARPGMPWWRVTIFGVRECAECGQRLPRALPGAGRPLVCCSPACRQRAYRRRGGRASGTTGAERRRQAHLSPAAGSDAVGGEAGGASLAEFASLRPGWGVGAGRRVEALAFVVVGVSGDEPGVVPGLDGSGGHAEQRGGFGQGEQAGVAESLLAAAQVVVVADVADGEPVEGAALAAGQAAVVEDAGDLGVGAGVE
jgi:hypothetical protein